jgi:hypothetical protein
VTARKTPTGGDSGGARSAVPGDIGESSRGEKAKGRGISDRDRLEALRSRLEGVLSDPETPARDLASCSREYRQVLDALAKWAPADATSRVDEIAARRKRRSGT